MRDLGHLNEFISEALCSSSVVDGSVVGRYLKVFHALLVQSSRSVHDWYARYYPDLSLGIHQDKHLLSAEKRPYATSIVKLTCPNLKPHTILPCSIIARTVTI